MSNRSKVSKSTKAEAEAVLSSSPASSTPDRQREIAEVAYYRAEKRGFEPGHEEEDWIAAEQELNNAAAG